MPDPGHRAGLFPALLKHWRGQRGLSQIDLALAADVSSRHISFLETGRSRPSAEMVLRLGSTLGVPLRHVNGMLDAAGHDRVYDEGGAPLPSAVQQAIEALKHHQEPCPLIVVDTTYEVRDVNDGALRLFGALMGGEDAARAAVAAGLNLARLTFDPAGAHPYLVNADDVGRELLWRIQREVLADPDATGLRVVLDDILALPTVDPSWRDVDLSIPSEPALVVHLRTGDVDLRFLTMVTVFQAPQNAVVEELRVESWFPVDEATSDVMHALAG
ncbi:helix-turn-helix transcriptional regulator [soil metagenome]